MLMGCTPARTTEDSRLRVQSESESAMRPVASGFADVNGIRLYHEIYGAGEPLVLLHGGLMTITEMAPLVEVLAAQRRFRSDSVPVKPRW